MSFLEEAFQQWMRLKPQGEVWAGKRVMSGRGGPLQQGGGEGRFRKRAGPGKGPWGAQIYEAGKRRGTLREMEEERNDQRGQGEWGQGCKEEVVAKHHREASEMELGNSFLHCDK